MKMLGWWSPFNIALALGLMVLGSPILGYGQKMDNTSQEAGTVALPLKGIKEPVKIQTTLGQALKTYPQIKDAKKLDSFLAKKRGGDVSGGGTTLLINGQRFLIDLFGEINFSETANSSDSFGRGNLDRIDLQRTSLHTEIQASIERVKSASPSLGSALEQVYNKTYIFFARGRFVELDTNFYLNEEIDYPLSAEVSTSALSIKDFGIIFSRDEFLEMNQSHRVGLILHELLRTLQIGFASRLSNFELQSLTLAAMQDSASVKKALPELFCGDCPNGKVFSFLRRYAEISEQLGDGSKLEKPIEKYTSADEIFDAIIPIAHLRNALAIEKLRGGPWRPEIAELSNIIDELRRIALWKVGDEAFSAVVGLSTITRNVNIRGVTNCAQYPYAQVCEPFYKTLRELIR